MNNIYYKLKPLIPRKLQIAIRRKIVTKKRLATADVWPIDEEARYAPNDWPGWPDQKQFAVTFQHDVDTQKGHDNCYKLIALEEKLGVRSSFNFVPERYSVSESLRNILTKKGFEVGVHGLVHDGKLFSSRKIFNKRAPRINYYLHEWKSKGFSSPSMHRNLDWIQDLNISHATCTFDTDPFEPQPDGVKTIFPIWIQSSMGGNGYVELPYTIPQDFTLFILMREKTIAIWKQKLDWIAEHGGMALLNTHPDYMNFSGNKYSTEEYTSKYYEEFLEYIKSKYDGRYWHALPKDIAHFWQKNMAKKQPPLPRSRN